MRDVRIPDFHTANKIYCKPKLNSGHYFIGLQNKTNGTLQNEKYIQQ